MNIIKGDGGGDGQTNSTRFIALQKWTGMLTNRRWKVVRIMFVCNKNKNQGSSKGRNENLKELL